MRIVQVAAISVILTMFGIVMLVAYWLFYPYVAVEMYDLPIPVANKQVKAGGFVELEMHFSKNSSCIPIVKWYLVDGFTQELSDGAIRRPTGEQDITRLIFIPETAPKTKVHIRIEYSCRVNPIRVAEYSWDTEEFEII